MYETGHMTDEVQQSADQIKSHINQTTINQVINIVL